MLTAGLNIPKSEPLMDTRELNVFLKITDICAKERDENRIIDQITDLVLSTLKISTGGILLYSERSGRIADHPTFRRGPRNRPMSLRLGQGITGLAALSGSAMNIADIRCDPNYVMADPDTRSELVVPLQAYGKLIGVIDAQSTSLAAFSSRAQDFLTVMASHVSLAICHSRSARRLLEQEELCRSVFENTASAMALVGEDLTIHRVNHEWVHLTGHSVQEIEENMKWTEFMVPEDRGASQLMFLADTRNPRQSVRTKESRFKTRDGQIRNFIFRWSMMPSCRKALITCVDITDQKRDEAERAERLEHLYHSEKLEAIGQLAGGVAHDFNNQLSVVMGYAERLLDLSPDEQQSQCIEKILLVSHRSADLASQLLRFARKGKMEHLPFDVNDLIDEVYSLLSHSIDKNISIERKLTASNPIIVGDQSQIQNALMNLAINARDAMPKGGTILFGTKARHLSVSQCAHFPYQMTPGDYIEIIVADTGEGIDPRIKRRIFEPFYTTKGKGKGTGMGLASVYGTIKHHKGSIDVYSKQGRGSCFKILLPLAEITAPKPEEPFPSFAPTPGANILVVDDEPLLTETMTECLRKMQLNVSICHDGVQALAFYREKWQELSLVILDLNMPRMNGEEVLKAMKQINPLANIVIMSGYCSEKMAERLLNAGAIEFLQKPFRLTQLECVLSKALA